MDIRKSIRKIISEMFDNGEFGTELAQKTSNAKRALIALSKNMVSNKDVKIHGLLHGADFDESGPTGSQGEVEIEWDFEGMNYSVSVEVNTDFYYTKGSSGKWGSSVDDSQAPESDDIEDVEVHIQDDEIKVYDEDGEEHAFSMRELGKGVARGLEMLILNDYDPAEEQVDSR
jgi:hypothetical protein